ncbi:MAG: CaiB/BaiF CoA-transferase family protein [Pseudomonadota bacterium]
MSPLDGVLVVSIEQAVAAPLCTARLSAAGARVIKIERDSGDFARGYDTAAKGESSYFTWLNQGKESVCTDFKSEEGRELLTALLIQADVLVQNLSPGALERSGFSLGQLHKINPRLIVCNISGYGSTGQASGKPAYDLLVQAESGLVSVSGDKGHPGRIGVSICDIGAGVTAHAAILEALMKREKTGHGEEVNLSLFSVASEWMMVPYIHAEYGSGAPEPAGLKHPSIAPYGAFECSDGKQILISIQNEREWERLCLNALDSPQLFNNINYTSNNDRVTNREQLDTEINDITKNMASSEFQSRLDASGIAYGAINTADDLKHHPATELETYRNGNGDELLLPSHPVKAASYNAASMPRQTPKIGQHTQKIKDEFL